MVRRYNNPTPIKEIREMSVMDNISKQLVIGIVCLFLGIFVVMLGFKTISLFFESEGLLGVWFTSSVCSILVVTSAILIILGIAILTE